MQHRQCQTRGGQVGARQGHALGHPARREAQLGVSRCRQTHVVAARGVQTGQRARRRGPGQELTQRGDLEQGVGAVRGDDALDAQHIVVGQVRVDRHPRVQQTAQLLVQRDDGGQALAGGVVGLGEVPLHAHVAPQGGPGPEVEVEVAQSGVGPPRADVGSHQLGRKQQRGAALNVLAVVGIDAVRGPHPLGALHDPQVDAAAAAGAGLDLQGWEALVERVQESVDGQGLVVDGGRPLASCGGVGDLMPCGQQGGVVVPLEVGDIEALHEGGDGLEQVVPGTGGGQVQDPLVAVLGRSAGAVGQDPLRVGAGQLGVDVDHLRLEPQAELHAQGVDVLHERLQAVRPGLGGDLPVAQSRGVVAAGAEPAVVQDVALDTDLGGGVGQGLELVQVMVEVDGLPGVEQHWAGAVGVSRVRAQPGVAAVGQGVQSLAPGEDRPRRGVGLTGGQ